MSSEARSPHSHGTSVALQVAIIALLVVVVVVLHNFAGPATPGLDPTAMLALGFVVLTSYTVGGLVEGIRLPHITGYLIAGMLLGPSVAEILPSALRFLGVTHVPAPFDRGVLNPTVIDQLGMLDELAVALIAITAGGELKIDTLKRGLRTVVRILAGQTLATLILITGFVVLISGAIPAITLPGLGQLSTQAAVLLGMVVAAVSLATSPAATIAVINETRSAGDMTRTILGTVVLKDVVVMVAFAITTVLAAEALGFEAEASGNLWGSLAREILGQIGAGLVLGVVMALYLRFVGRELLLFVVGVIYLATFTANQLHLTSEQPILLFLAAGFTVANFSPSGDDLVHTVERLSLPVYVVFFTLAGARLHLVELWDLLLFAVALCTLRMASMWAGMALSVRGPGADLNLRRYGFMGYMSQAGVAISLAAIVGNSLGDAGRALETLLIGGVAINELVGPVLLKVGLGLAQEVGKAGPESEGDEEPTDEEGGAAVRAKAPATPPRRVTVPPAGGEKEPDDGQEDRLSSTGLSAWRSEGARKDLWGPPCRSATPALNVRMAELESDLQALVRDVTRGPLSEFRQEAEMYLRELRREFLRHHRRVTVQSRSEEQRAELALMIRSQQAELAERWRGIVLGRSAKMGRSGWSPERIIDALDSIVDGLPSAIPCRWEPRTFEPRDDEGVIKAIRRAGLRLRRRWNALFGSDLPDRSVELSNLGRFHLSGKSPSRLEGLAALFVQADRHLAARTRSIFDGIVGGYEEVARRLEDPEVELETVLGNLRAQVEQELALALEEVRRITRDGTRRTAQVLAGGIVRMKDDVLVYDTLDLPPRKRRSSRVFRQRLKAIERLTGELEALRKSGAAGYSLLAMELELVGLEARIKEALEEHCSRLTNEVRRRAVQQIERVHASLKESIDQVDQEIKKEQTAGELAAGLRAVTEGTEKVAGEASRIVSALQEELLDERKVAPILDALKSASVGLTDSYHVIAGQIREGEWRLPAAVGAVEVDFREHVSHYLESHVAPKLLAASREVATKAGPMAAALAELERLVAFNVELGTAELEVVADEAVPEDTQNLLRDMVTGQLERSLAQVRSYVESARHWPTDLDAGLRDSVLGGIDELRRGLLDGEISQASLGAMRRAARFDRFFEVFGRLPSAARSARRQSGRAVRSVVGDERIERIRRWLGIPSRKPVQDLDPRMFAAPKVRADLPMVYRRLFAPDTMEAVDVLTGRQGDIDRAIEVLAREAPGRLRTVALVGVDGVGKAAVAAAIIRGRRWKNLKRVSFTEPRSVEDVEALFTEGGEGQLVVIEGLHWLLGMQPGGFDPLRRFVDGIIRDGGRRAWLIHLDSLVWDFSTNAASLAEAFPTTIRIEPLTADELQSAVIARHDMSGFSHGFDRSVDGNAVEGFLARLGSRFRRPYDRYFQDLHDSTGGLVRDALRMWLASIERIDDGEVVVVGKVPHSPYGALSRLPEPVLLILYQVSRQGWMDATIHSFLFRVDEGSARAQLMQLAHLGLLSEEHGIFRVAVHLKGPLIRLLTHRGWIQ